jgi:hypothetical protein
MAGTLTISTLSDGTNSTSSTNCIQGSAKAWVNFDGQTGAGNIIRASYNVSSITKNATGRYTTNFTNALSDANYCAVVTVGEGTSSGITYRGTTTTPTTTAYQFESTNSSQSAYEDALYASVAIFR